jgi:hypothetical protein
MEIERTIMGNIAIVGDLPGMDELEQVYRLDASEARPEGMPSEDVPAGMPSEDQPAGMPSEDVPAGMPSEDVPAGMPSEDVPAGMPSEDVPAGMPSEDVPAGMPSEDVPAGMPSEDVPSGPPSEDVPGIRPEGMPSELWRRSSVAGAARSASVTLDGQPAPVAAFSVCDVGPINRASHRGLRRNVNFLRVPLYQPVWRVPVT